MMLDVHNVHPLGCGPFDGGIDVVNDIAVVFGNIILNVDNDKCFIVLHLLNHKTTWIEITVEAAVSGGELQDAVVRVGNATWVVLLVAIAPNHLLALGIRQYLHRAAQHHTLEALGIAEIDRGLGVGLIVSHTEGEGVCGKIERLDALADSW